ncbi:MAG: hypothetical protein ACPLRY_05425 [Candidatus Bathyarchaeales archaeon]
MKTENPPSPEVNKASKTAQHSYKLALVTGAISLGFSAFMAYVYYAHILILPETPIGAARYMASTHAIATTFFTLSFTLGLIALINYKSSLSFKLMLTSAATAIVGYIPPSERLWRLGYINSLNETGAIAVIHIALTITSAYLLYKKTPT